MQQMLDTFRYCIPSSSYKKQFTNTLFLQPPHSSNTIKSTKFPPHPPRCMLLVVISREPRCFTVCNRCKALLHGALLSTLHRWTRFGRKPWSSCSNLWKNTACWHNYRLVDSNPRKNVWRFVGRYHFYKYSLRWDHLGSTSIELHAQIKHHKLVVVTQHLSKGYLVIRTIGVIHHPASHSNERHIMALSWLHQT